MEWIKESGEVLMEKLQPGIKINLTVEREVSFGYFLSNGEEDVLLHEHEVVGEIEIGDQIEVFLFNDKEGRITASMHLPAITEGEYGWVPVVDVHASHGVFLDIGLQKDLLISSDDLPKLKNLWPEKGDELYVTLKVDNRGRIFGRLATETVVQDLSKDAPMSMLNKNFEGRAYRLLKVGTFILTTEGYRCFVHESERSREPRLGELVKGRVVDVKDDGSMNGSLLPRTHERLDEDSEDIYMYLESRGGSMPYWDKSNPEDIQKRFGMSKGAFKRAIGRLMKDGKVRQEEGWTYIIKQ